jgi:hypothetical protein
MLFRASLAVITFVFVYASSFPLEDVSVSDGTAAPGCHLSTISTCIQMAGTYFESLRERIDQVPHEDFDSALSAFVEVIDSMSLEDRL